METRTQQGNPAKDLIVSAYRGTNADAFPNVVSLHVPKGSTIADVTYGKGVFWRNIPDDAFKVLKTDLSTGVDCRDLPYEDETIAAVVFDPPYMHSPGGSAHGYTQGFEESYKNNGTSSKLKYHEAVLDLYFLGAKEAHRVLQNEGTLIVKCQDEVCSGKQRLTHVEIIEYLEKEIGFVCQDLFVLMSNRHLSVSRQLAQRHARKRHSYFLVFRKPKGKSIWKGVPTDARWMP